MALFGAARNEPSVCHSSTTLNAGLNSPICSPFRQPLDYFSVASRAVISQERQVLTAPDARDWPGQRS